MNPQKELLWGLRPMGINTRKPKALKPYNGSGLAQVRTTRARRDGCSPLELGSGALGV